MHCVSLLPSTMSGDELLLWQGAWAGQLSARVFLDKFRQGGSQKCNSVVPACSDQGGWVGATGASPSTKLFWQFTADATPAWMSRRLPTRMPCSVKRAAFARHMMCQLGLQKSSSCCRRESQPRLSSRVGMPVPPGTANSKEPSERACSTCCNAPSQPWISCSGMPAPLVLRLHLLKRPFL